MCWAVLSWLWRFTCVLCVVTLSRFTFFYYCTFALMIMEIPLFTMTVYLLPRTHQAWHKGHKKLISMAFLVECEGKEFDRFLVQCPNKLLFKSFMCKINGWCSLQMLTVHAHVLLDDVTCVRSCKFKLGFLAPPDINLQALYTQCFPEPLRWKNE